MVDGVSRMPGVEDITATLANPTGGPASLFSLLAAFSGGKMDSYEDFSMALRCLTLSAARKEDAAKKTQ